MGTGVATAAPPTCGSTINSNTTLTADVGPCNDSNGLNVTGNATLDLNGHKVFSDATLPRNDGTEPDDPTTFVPADFVGILVHATGATVKNGTVHNFSAGVSIEGGGSNTVQHIAARDNQGPCIGEDFSTQAVGKYGDGIVMFGSSNNKILSNTVVNNGPFSGISVVANTDEASGNITKAVPPLPTGNLIKGNKVDKNDLCFGEIGIRIEGPGATKNTVEGNTVTDSFLEGIAVLAVNQIDFRGLFHDPPTCQNRGFPPTHDGSFTAGSPVVTVTDGDFSKLKVGDPLSSPAFPSPIAGGTTVAAVDVANNQITMSSNATATGDFPFGNLPLCPLQDPLNPNNDNNVIKGNHADGNGYGGPQIPAGPGPDGQNNPSLQQRAGIQLLSFCGDAVSNGTGNQILRNRVTTSAGDGISVGGCPLSRPPRTFVGFTNSKVLSNVSFNNNGRGCGVLPSAPGCGRPTSERFDLVDTTHVISCPSTNAATQTMCAAMGFPPPPPPPPPTMPPTPPTPFVATRVVQTGGQACDNNVWNKNSYKTAFPHCTTTGGKKLP